VYKLSPKDKQTVVIKNLEVNLTKRDKHLKVQLEAYISNTSY